MSRTDNENIPNSCQQQTQQSTELNSPLPELYTIDFFSQRIHCFRVGREDFLWFPEVLCKVLYEYSYLDILTACEYFKIKCMECDPAQLKSLKQSNMLREDDDISCLIRKFDATLLCEAIAQEMESCKDPPFELRIFHECFGRCEGLFQLRFHLSLHSPCIRCQYCFEYFNPLEFVVHCHRIDKQPKCGPKVNPAKWWKYIFAHKEEWRSEFLTKRMLNELKYRFLDHSEAFPISKRYRRRTPSLKHAVVHSPLTDDSAIELN